MKKHAAWELLPQICVVSGNYFVGNAKLAQGHGSLVTIGYTRVIPASNLRFQPLMQIYAEIPAARPTPALIMCDSAHAS